MAKQLHPIESAQPGDPNRSCNPLLGYYLIGIVAITIGISVVIVLNLTTPMGLVWAATLQLSLRQAYLLNLPLWLLFVLRFLVLVIVAYLPVLCALYWMLIPIRRVLKYKRTGRLPTDRQMVQARRRVLNLPYYFAPLSISLWILFPAVFFHGCYLTGMMAHKTAIILSIRASMVGLIASAIASHRIEDHSRRRLIPLFFPDGRLSEVGGVAKLSIAKRIKLVYKVGSIVPMTILVVTLLTLQWELDHMKISAVAYGRGLLLFAFTLLAYVVVSTTVLNRLVTRSITTPLNHITKVLKKVRGGVFNLKVPIYSNDEIGYTGEVINEMCEGLEERDRLRSSLTLAMEVQQSLLPSVIPRRSGLDLAAMSIYCDETGGDYFDFIDLKDDEFGMVLGGVAGHGISSALLMATARAFFRHRASQPGDLAVIVNDVNRLLAHDIANTGQFMTLFFLAFSNDRTRLKWVRAGHDPGLLYDPETDHFMALKGEGIALGVEPKWEYRQFHCNGLKSGQIVLLGTDGIWEARNDREQYYGKKRLKQSIRNHAASNASKILTAIINDHKTFIGQRKAEDDITLMVAKITA